MSDAPRPIVAGFDGSENAYAALRWAAGEGIRTGVPVELVYALDLPVAGFAGLAPGVWPDFGAPEEADRIVAEGLEKIRQSHPDARVTGVVLPGAATAVMVERSQAARLLVLGGRGAGGFVGQLIGSTSISVSAHAKCPVVVVRGRDPANEDPIVVGVDFSDYSQLAADFAFAEAASRGTSLRVIRAWEPPPDSDQRARTDAEQAATEELIAGWREKYPQVATSVHLVGGSPAEALVHASASARLIVVGSRGHGGFRGMLLGSVSQQLLYHADCPVAIVREISG